MLKSQGPRLILASNSTVRRAMLRQAGLEITIHPSDVDEGGAKAALQAGNATGAAIAAALAQAKARAVARDHPDAWVIGAAQILSCDGELFDKAPNFAAATTTLQSLKGRWHELHAAVCVVRDGDGGMWLHGNTPVRLVCGCGRSLLSG